MVNRFIQKTVSKKLTASTPAHFIYFNRPFDKSRLKGLLKWTLERFGEKKTVDLVETLKNVGYTSATHAGLSLSIEDLSIPKEKGVLIAATENQLQNASQHVFKGYLTSVEYLSQVIVTWNETNDAVKNEVIKNFRSKDVLNPVYMMAFSGARGNISQVRQLVGMRGLMADPKGNIIDFPIQSNFREGLTLTEYIISCYGSRKGVVDTALRTATSGYLTRRLVDVAQHVVIRLYDCKTTKGMEVFSLETPDEVLLDGETRLVGRVLAKDVYDNCSVLLAKRNDEVTPKLAKTLFQHKTKILVRSPLTCEDRQYVCQLCYGWSLSTGRLAPLGETIGVIAAQSIGEPGTQLTMRTFHTGGVFSGAIAKKMTSPVKGHVFFLKSIPGKCVRTAQGEIAFLTKEAGYLLISENAKVSNLKNPGSKRKVHRIFLKPYTLLFVKQGEQVYFKQVLAENSSFAELSGKLKEFQTIYAQHAGEVKFRNAALVQCFFNPLFTKDTQLSGTMGEFWVLSAQKQTFLKPLNMWMQAGDFVELESPVLNYRLFSDTYRKSDFSHSVPFQQELFVYRTNTLIQLFASYQSTYLNVYGQKTLRLPFFSSDGSNMSFSSSSQNQQNQLWFKQWSTLEKKNTKGTFIERQFPFFAMKPKVRGPLVWQSLKKKYSKRNVPLTKKLVPKRLLKKNNTISLSLYQPFLNDYPFVFMQKHFLPTSLSMSLGFRFNEQVSSSMTQLKKAVLQKTLQRNQVFDGVFQPLRSKETTRLFFCHNPWTLFDKYFFLPVSSKKTNSDVISFEKKNQWNRFYCHQEPLWTFFSLAQPTKNLQTSFTSLFPKGLILSLHRELFSFHQSKSLPKNLQTLHFECQPTFHSFFYYRICMHFRFQKKYSQGFLNNLFIQKQFFKVVPYKLPYERLPKYFYQTRGQRPLLQGEVHYDLDVKVQTGLKERPRPYSIVAYLNFAPRVFLFTERIEDSIQKTGIFFALKTSLDYERQLLLKQQVKFIQPTEKETTVSLQTHGFLLLKNSQQNLLNKAFWFKQLFTFHELIHIPFCFSNNKKSLQPMRLQPMLLCNEKVLPTVNMFLFLFHLNCYQVNNLPLSYKKKLYCQTFTKPLNQQPTLCFVTEQKTQPSFEETCFSSKKFLFNQNFIFFQLLTKKATLHFDTQLKSESLKFVYQTFLFIVVLNKLGCWQQSFKKMNELTDLYGMSFWTTTRAQNVSMFYETGSKKKLTLMDDSKMKESIFVFVHKRATQRATIRSFNPLCFKVPQKTLWLSKKEHQTKIRAKRLALIYHKTQSKHLLTKTWFQLTILSQTSSQQLFKRKRKSVSSGETFFTSYFNFLFFKTHYYCPLMSSNHLLNGKTTTKKLWHLNQFKQTLLSYSKKVLNQNVKTRKVLKKNKTAQPFLYRRFKKNKKVIESFTQSWLQYKPNFKTNLRKIPVKAYVYLTNGSLFMSEKSISMQTLYEDRLFLHLRTYTSFSELKPMCLFFLFSPYKLFCSPMFYNSSFLMQCALLGDPSFSTFSDQTNNQLNKTGLKAQTLTTKSKNVASSKKKVKATKSAKKGSTKKVKKGSTKTKKGSLKKGVKTMKNPTKKGSMKKDSKARMVTTSMKENFQTNKNNNKIVMIEKRHSILGRAGIYKENQFNPLNWVTLMKPEVSFVSNWQYAGKTRFVYQNLGQSSVNQILFSFPLFHFQETYDSFFLNQMNYLYVWSVNQLQKEKMSYSSSLLTKPVLFIQHVNPFFHDYLEKGFFFAFDSYNLMQFSKNEIENQLMLQPNDQASLTKKLKHDFMSLLTFYTEVIRLKVKKSTSVRPVKLNRMKQRQAKKNKEKMNHYIRFIFLKKAKLPAVLATKLTVEKKRFPNSSVSKRLVMIHHQHIYFPQSPRYRPSLLIDGVFYKKRLLKKGKKKRSKSKKLIHFITKSSYALSMTQKLSKFFTGDNMVKTLLKSQQMKNRSLVKNIDSLMTITPQMNGQKTLNTVKIKLPSCQTPYFFDHSTVNKYESLLVKNYFNQMYVSLIKNNKTKFYVNKKTDIYFRQLFRGNFHVRFDFQTLSSFLLLNSYNQYSRQIKPNRISELSFNTKPKINKLITEVSPMKGEVLHCFTLKDKQKNYPIYKHETMRFRYKEEQWLGISYLTNQDLITYKVDSTLNSKDGVQSNLGQSPWSKTLGSLISYGENITAAHCLNEPGQIIYLTNTKAVVRQAQCFLLAAGGECKLSQGEHVSVGSPLVTVTYSNVQTEDIIQGIPKIDQLFEARSRLGFVNLKEALQNKHTALKLMKTKDFTKRDILLQSVAYIQRYIVDGIQTVYQSQGVTISDKHIEVIVKQMTSKVQVHTAMGTGFLRGDIIPLHLVELHNFDAEDKLFECEPILLGITKASLQATGFISAASFQETVRILSQASVFRTTDFLKGLKENIIVGHLLPTGTGLPLPKVNK